VVYALAAYSITLGVLLVYGFWLQHRARVARVRVELAAGGAGAETAVRARLARGLNPGAALLAPFWAWAHGLRGAGAGLVAATAALVWAQANGLRPAVLFLSSLLVGAICFFAVAGNRIALARTPRPDPAAFEAGQLPWAIAGALVHAFVVPWAWYFWRGGS